MGVTSQYLSLIITLVIGILMGFLIRLIYGRIKLVTAEQKAQEILKDAKENSEKELRKSEAKAKEMVLEAKEQILKDKKDFEREKKEKQNEVAAYEKRILNREENLDRRISNLESKEQSLDDKESYLKIKFSELDKKEKGLEKELEKIAGLSKEEAKKRLEDKLKRVVDDEVFEYYNLKIEDAEINADKRAREVLVTVMERLAPELTKDVNISNITLPDDEMKGRIIGREGRNIRTLENILGVDIIIDDTPEIVTISGFDPIRRHVAKLTMERLIKDGRIHPARIEEVYEKVKSEVDQHIIEDGSAAVYDLGLHHVPAEVIRHLGRLSLRTSYGQNVLTHSKEVSRISAGIASVIGADVELARKAGLYHDIGKAVYSEEGNKHVEEGVKLLRGIRADEKIIQCVANHHESSAYAQNYDGGDEKEIVEAVIVRIADTISAARPGARFNEGAWEDYVRRVEELEKEATKFEEVEKAFAIQAGREIRVFLNVNVPEKNVDAVATELKKNIQINKKIKYPGRIKITVIKESRHVEYTD